MSASLEDLRREHAEQVIGSRLCQLCEDVVRATARTYPASEYAEARAWNRSSLEEALQDWVTVRLLGRGDLSKMLAQAASSGSLRGMLSRSFAHFLVNRRKPSAAANLFKRTTKMLREDDGFVSVGKGATTGEQLWTLSGVIGDQERSSASMRELVASAFDLDDRALKVVRYKPDSDYESPILRNPQLKVFLIHLLTHANGALDQSTIAAVMAQRFDLPTIQHVELLASSAVGEATEFAKVETGDVVVSVIRRLGQERLRALREFHRAAREGEEVHEISELPPAVSDTIAMIAAVAKTPEEADEIYDHVVATLV